MAASPATVAGVITTSGNTGGLIVLGCLRAAPISTITPSRGLITDTGDDLAGTAVASVLV
jgi:hypothetical protein